MPTIEVLRNNSSIIDEIPEVDFEKLTSIDGYSKNDNIRAGSMSPIIICTIVFYYALQR